MIWDKFAAIRGLFNTERVLAAQVKNMPRDLTPETDMARRWSKARRQCPELLNDLLQHGGILASQPMQGGEVLPLDPNRLAYEAGRRDLALQLAALMSLTIEELNDLMENPDA